MTYGKALGILLAVAFIVTGLWKLHDAIGDAREAKVRGELQAVIDSQNKAIEELQKAASQENKDAAGRVVTVLQNGEIQKRTLPQGYGPAVMNQWFDEAFP